MRSVIVDTGKLKVGEVFPFTRSHRTTQVTMQPTIIIEDSVDGEQYVLSGMKVLWTLLNQVMDKYYRNAVKDHLFFGPTDAFVEGLQTTLKTYDGMLVFNLCEPEGFQNVYGRPAMVNTRTAATQRHNIVQTVSSSTQDSTLNHIMGVMEAVGVTLNYDGTESKQDWAPRSNRKWGGVIYRFTQEVGGFTQRLLITVGPTGVLMAEAYNKHNEYEYEMSPFDQLLKMTEQDPKYLGPWLSKIQRGLDESIETVTETHHQRIRTVWEREVEGWGETPSSVGRQRRMMWRNKAYRYGGML